MALRLDPAARAGIQASQATVQRIVDEDQVVYGINTGFGKLASTKIAHERLAELQRNLVLSHSVGTGAARCRGAPGPGHQAVSLARGHSGIRPKSPRPCWRWPMPTCCRDSCQGSVGASGDLAPLAHGVCADWRGQAKVNEKIVSGKGKPWRPWAWCPSFSAQKEGLALLNGAGVHLRWRSQACLAQGTCLLRPWWPVACRSKPSGLGQTV